MEQSNVSSSETQKEITIDEIKEKWSEIVRAARTGKNDFLSFFMGCRPLTE